MFKPTIEDLIRQAATSLILEAFETDLDLLPFGFKLIHHGIYGGNFVVEGPRLWEHDSDMVGGIFINTHRIETCYVRVAPFNEIDLRAEFLYADPAFPQNAIDFIDNGLGIWASWWDVFKEEGQLDHLAGML